jgi:hypothetical protein
MSIQTIGSALQNNSVSICYYNSEVFITTQFEAIHNWPNCPFEEVSYLRDPHRHIFHIKACKQVTHDDRDIEFIMLKHAIDDYLKETYPIKQFGAKSCEMLARELIDKFELCRCEVSEDGENGAILSRHVV